MTGDPWNALGYDGLKKAEKDLGVQIALTDNLQPAGFEAAMRDYASQGYNLVIGHSFGFGDSAKAITNDFPNTFFTVNTGAVADARVASFNLQDQQNGYLSGALAAMTSKTGVLGILGGLDYPSVIKEINGFVDGAKAVNPNIKVLVGYVGSWDDPAKAQELAKSMIEQKADVLSHKAGVGRGGDQSGGGGRRVGDQRRGNVHGDFAEGMFDLHRSEVRQRGVQHRQALSRQKARRQDLQLGHRR